jgi:PAS domain S-box-containing protein
VRDITQRRHDEQSLRESQIDLKRAQAVAQTGSWRIDVHSNHLTWSDETYKICGIPIGQPLNFNKFLSLVHPEDRNYVEQRWQAALDGAPYNIEHRIMVGDSVKWVRERAELEFDENGLLTSGFGTIQDITARKQNEAALNNSLRRFELLAQTASDLLTSSEPQKIIQSICQKVMALLDCQYFFNYLKDEESGHLRLHAYAGMTLEEAAPILWLDLGQGISGCVAQNGKPRVCENIAENKDPLVYLAKFYSMTAYVCHPLYDSNGDVFGTLSFGTRQRGSFNPEDIALIEAVTNQVAVALVRNEQENALRVSEERFRVALLGSPIVVFTQDLELRYTWAYNPSDGFTVEDILGKRDEDIYKPEDAQIFSRIKEEVLASGVGRRDEVVTHRPASEGGDMVHDMTTEPLRDASGVIVGVICAAMDITERKRIEEELRKSEAQQTFLLNLSDKMSLLTDPREIMRASAEALGLRLGVSSVGYCEIGGDGKTACAHGEYGDGRMPSLVNLNFNIPSDNGFFKVLEDGGDLFYEDYRFDHRAGSEGTQLRESIRLRAGAAIPFHKHGRLVAYLYAVHPEPRIWPEDERRLIREVAQRTWAAVDRARAEDALRKSEERLRLATQTAGMVSWEIDLARQTIKWSENEKEVIDFPMPKTVREVMSVQHPDDQAKVIKTIGHVAQQGGEFEIEHRVIHPVKQQAIWIVSAGVAIAEPAGSPLRVVGVTQNITGRKRAEQTLRDAEHRQRKLAEDLDVERGKLKAIIDSLPVGLWIADATGKMILINENARDIWKGATPFADSIKDYEVYRSWWADTGQPIRAEDMPMVRSLRGEILKDLVVEIERFDGTPGTQLVSSAPIMSSDGGISGGVTIVQDITEIKRSERALRELNETLEQRVSQRTQLAEARAKQLQALAVELIEAEERERQRIAVLLHEDLQQIIAGARLLLQSTCEDLPPAPELLKVENMLLDAIDKSRRLSHELSPTVLHHLGLVAALQWLVRHMQEQYGLQVELKVEDAQHLEKTPFKVFIFRAVQELLFNINKHAGVKSAKVELSSSKQSLIIMVVDQGQGFDSEKLNSDTNIAGLGLLGLQERASYLGGSFMIESAPGAGSTFTLTIPKELQGAGKPEQVGLPSSPQLNTPVLLEIEQTGGVRVLIADDHKVMRQGLARLISAQPEIQIVGEAANGMEALELARKLRPDVIVMDISMPEMDGIEATRRIKSELPEIRVIGLSMFEDEQTARSILDAGAESFMSKTASSAELLKAIYGSK